MQSTGVAMSRQTLYLILAIVGAIIPYYFFLQHWTSQGIGIVDFVRAVFATAPASGFAADLFIASFVFWIAMFARCKKSNSPSPFLFIALNLTIGLSCALPAYLYSVEKRSGRVGA